MLETDNTNQVLDLIEDVISMIKKRDEVIRILHERITKLENK